MWTLLNRSIELPDAGGVGSRKCSRVEKISPASRVATSQLKEPRVMLERFFARVSIFILPTSLRCWEVVFLYSGFNTKHFKWSFWNFWKIQDFSGKCNKWLENTALSSYWLLGCPIKGSEGERHCLQCSQGLSLWPRDIKGPPFQKSSGYHLTLGSQNTLDPELAY